MKTWKSAVVMTGLLTLILSEPARAEFYIAAQGGMNMPDRLTNVKGTGTLQGTTFNDLRLSNGAVYGGKAGYYFNWVGLEVDGYYSKVKIEPQQLVATQGTLNLAFNTREADLAVTTFALNLLARYPGETFQPYIGAGPALFFAKASSPGAVSDTDTTVGLSAIAGLRVMLTQRLGLFAEYKFNRANFTFGNAFPPSAGISGDYKPNLFVGGLSLHF